ncbi:MAG: preprotein translocase subunit SecE [Bacteroidales bacterium]|nr:preprotein translocase subunit SecE [Bacteroidales bacterium]
MANFKILTDLQDSYNELVHKVSWPSKKDLANSTVIVMVASILIAIVIFAIDKVFDLVMDFIYGL